MELNLDVIGNQVFQSADRLPGAAEEDRGGRSLSGPTVQSHLPLEPGKCPEASDPQRQTAPLGCSGFAIPKLLASPAGDRGANRRPPFAPPAPGGGGRWE